MTTTTDAEAGLGSLRRARQGRMLAAWLLVPEEGSHESLASDLLQSIERR